MDILLKGDHWNFYPSPTTRRHDAPMTEESQPKLLLSMMGVQVVVVTSRVHGESRRQEGGLRSGRLEIFSSHTDPDVAVTHVPNQTL